MTGTGTGCPLPVTCTGGWAVVTMPDEIDIVTAAVVGDALLTVLGGTGQVIADMAATTFCDAAGTRMLTRVQRSAHAQHAELRIAAASDLALRVLTLLEARRLLEIFPSVSAALETRSAAGPAR